MLYRLLIFLRLLIFTFFAMILNKETIFNFFKVFASFIHDFSKRIYLVLVFTMLYLHLIFLFLMIWLLVELNQGKTGVFLFFLNLFFWLISFDYILKSLYKHRVYTLILMYANSTILNTTVKIILVVTCLSLIPFTPI